VNFQNGDNAANAADVPIGTGVRIFDDSQAAHVIIDVMGYYRDVGCQAGTVKALGLCFETALRAATTVFIASDVCRDQGLPGGGRLGTGLELRSLRGGGPLTLAATGEWTESVYVNGVTFSAMTIADNGGFDDQPTLASHPYRCVFSPLP
jgi:hypothetical protein